MFAAIRKDDILLHHPYQSFEPVIDFIEQAADDPDVVAIKQTVYRTGVELGADGDPDRRGARRQGSHRRRRAAGPLRRGGEHQLGARLEEVGAHVVYGVVGHKTHAKMALVVRREERAAAPLRAPRHRQLPPAHREAVHRLRPVHAATRTICADVNEVFMQLTGLGRSAGRLKHLWQSPFTLHQQLIDAIRRETRARAKPESRRRIIAKMNALLEPRDHRRAVRGLAGRRRDRSHRARRVRAAAGRPGAVGEHPRALDRRPLPRALARLLLRERRRGDVYLPAPTGWTATSSGAIELAFPVLDAKLKKRVIERGLEDLPGRQQPGMGDAFGWTLRAAQADP